MNLNKFTIKSQEALQNAQEIASSYGNQSIEPEHLLAALVQDSEGAIIPILQKVGANVPHIKIRINELIGNLPKVSGGGMANLHLSQNSGKMFDAAQKEAEKLKDEYVSTEHLLLGMLEAATTASKLLREHGITQDTVYAALKDVRGNQRVTDQNPEDKFQALDKYGRDLTALEEAVDSCAA